MIDGTSTHFVLSAGYGSGGGGGGGYNRSRNDNDDSGSGGYNRGRNDHHSNSSGGGGGGDDSGVETQRDTIFIQNLPRTVTPSELKDVFSQIGMIKVKY
jgi:RNA recognition motif-containing protein